MFMKISRVVLCAAAISLGAIACGPVVVRSNPAAVAQRKGAGDAGVNTETRSWSVGEIEGIAANCLKRGDSIDDARAALEGWHIVQKHTSRSGAECIIRFGPSDSETPNITARFRRSNAAQYCLLDWKVD
jgi:hypothetical protein